MELSRRFGMNWRSIHYRMETEQADHDLWAGASGFAPRSPIRFETPAACRRRAQFGAFVLSPCRRKSPGGPSASRDTRNPTEHDCSNTASLETSPSSSCAIVGCLQQPAPCSPEDACRVDIILTPACSTVNGSRRVSKGRSKRPPSSANPAPKTIDCPDPLPTWSTPVRRGADCRAPNQFLKPACFRRGNTRSPKYSSSGAKSKKLRCIPSTPACLIWIHRSTTCSGVPKIWMFPPTIFCSTR